MNIKDITPADVYYRGEGREWQENHAHRAHTIDSKALLVQEMPVVTEAHVDNWISDYMRACQEKGYWELL